jgi:hypothetical protein
MAEVLLIRETNEHAATRPFTKAADALAAAESRGENIATAEHPSSCACQKAFEGWTTRENLEMVKNLAGYIKTKKASPRYEVAIKSLAASFGMTVEKFLASEERELERQRLRRENAAREFQEQLEVATLEAEKREKLRSECVSFCYQEISFSDQDKYLGGRSLHGLYRIVKKEDCYEFTLHETTMYDPSWRENRIIKVSLDAPMGVGSFAPVSPEKIHTA